MLPRWSVSDSAQRATWGGAGKWSREYSDTPRNADVVIFPDHDKAGREHANLVGKSLQGITRRVRLLELPGAGKDAADWVAAGGTGAQLTALIESAPEWAPEVKRE